MYELERLLEAAKRHGDLSEPDHEVGDLQGILRTCWPLLSKDQQKQVIDEHKELIEDWGQS